MIKEGTKQQTYQYPDVFSTNSPKAPVWVDKWVVTKDITSEDLSSSFAMRKLTSLNLKLENLPSFILCYYYFFDNLRSVKCIDYFCIIQGFFFCCDGRK